MIVTQDSLNLANLDTRYIGSIRGLAQSTGDIYRLAEHISTVDKTGYLLNEVLPVLQIALDGVNKTLTAYERAQQIKEENFKPLFLRFDENGAPIQLTEEEYKALTPSDDNEEVVNIE